MTLLSPESPLVASPAIAKRLGIEKALILEQLNYWLEHLTGKIVDGVKWIYASVAKHWTERIPLEPWKIRHLLEELVEEGYLKRGQWSKHSFYQAYFYTINRNKIDELIKSADVKKSRKSKNAETLKNQYLNRSTENPQIDLTTVLKSEQRSLLHKNSSPEDPPLPPQGGEGDNLNENSKTEESSANNSTPNQQTESMQQPENQSFDNFSAHSPEKEKPAIKTDKYFCERSVKNYKQERASKFVNYPEMLGLTPEELKQFESDCLDWGRMHPEVVKSPPAWLDNRIKACTVDRRVFEHLDHWKQHKTLKNFLDRIPHEWEEAYEDSFGWMQIRVKPFFKNWLDQEATKKTTANGSRPSPTEAAEIVANQLFYYNKAKALWEAYCVWLPNRKREHDEQIAMGLSGAGAIPSCIQDRSLPTLEQVNAIEDKFSQASQQFTLPQAKNFVQNVLDETTMQEEFTPEQCQENLRRFQQMRLEAELRFQEKQGKSVKPAIAPTPELTTQPSQKIKSSTPPPVPSYEQLQSLWRKGSDKARSQVIAFVMDSENYEFIHNETGHIIDIKEIDF